MNQSKKVDDEGKINSKLSEIGMTPRMHQQDSLSSQRMHDSMSFN